MGELGGASCRSGRARGGRLSRGGDPRAAPRCARGADRRRRVGAAVRRQPCLGVLKRRAARRHQTRRRPAARGFVLTLTPSPGRSPGTTWRRRGRCARRDAPAAAPPARRRRSCRSIPRVDRAARCAGAARPAWAAERDAQAGQRNHRHAQPRDGTRAFRLRFRVAGQRRSGWFCTSEPDCECGCGGGWDEPAARHELGNVLARVRAGVWQPPRTARRHAPRAARAPRRRSTSTPRAGCRARSTASIGARPIDPTPRSDYRWRLSVHLLPFFARYRLDEIDRELCLAFKAHKLRQAAELREAIAAGAELRDRRGRRLVPLSAGLGPQADRHARGDPRRRDRGRTDRPQPRPRWAHARPRPQARRTFLEMDELVALIDAAAAQDAAGAPRPATPPKDGSRAQGGRAPARRAAPGRRSPQSSASPSRPSASTSPACSATPAGAVRRPPSGHRDPRPQRRARQRTVRPALARRTPARPRRRALPHPRRQDRGRRTRGADDTRPRRGDHRAPRSPAPRRPPHRTRRRTSCRTSAADACAASASAQIVARGRRAATERLHRPGPAAAAAHDAAQPAPHLHLDRADRQQLRRQVGHEPGRPRRLQDDARRLRPGRAARAALPRHRASTASSASAREQLDRARQTLNQPQRLGHVWATRPISRPPSDAIEAPARNTKNHRDLQGPSPMARPGLEPGTPRFSVVCSTN